MTQRAQIRIKEAELQEPLVRLKQAERRLARLQRPAQRPAADGQQQEQRLRELEKKLSQILEEMKALQREMHRRKPGDRPDEAGRNESRSPAAKVWQIAEFYRRNGHAGSARFYYEVIRRRYVGTSFADRAADRIRELSEQPGC